MCVCVCAARLDYCGVIVLIITSHVPWLHFVFYCNRLVQFIYIASLLALGVAAVCFVMRDEFRRPGYRWIRFCKLFCKIFETIDIPSGALTKSRFDL